MIRLDLQRVLEEKGIDNPNRYLMQLGFTRHMAFNLLNNAKGSLNYKHLEKLCIALQCSPNDLLCWTNTDKYNDYAGHALQQLKRAPSRGNISTKIRQLAPDKLEQVRSFLDKLGS